MYALKAIAETMSTLLVPRVPSSRRKQSAVLPRSQWPDSIGATVDDLLLRMSSQDIAMLKTTKREDLILFHRGLGGSICHYYGLNKGNKKLFIAACGRRCNPKDVSVKIIEALWLRVRGN